MYITGYASRSILHLAVRPVAGFTADTVACQALIEHRRVCEKHKRQQAVGASASAPMSPEISDDTSAQHRAEASIRNLIEWLKQERERHVRFVMPSQMLDGD